MSIENPTIDQVEATDKPTPNLSEQFKVQRKNKLEKKDEKTKSDLKDLFNRYSTGPERIKAIQTQLKRFSHLLSEEQKEYLAKSISEIENIIDENEFVEKMFPVAKYYLGIKAEHLGQFEEIDRQRMYDEHPTYKELNQLFAYELEDGEIRLHVPSNEGTPIKDKLGLMEDGLKKLAEIVRDYPNIKLVAGRSWIVGEHPKLLERLGFEVSEIETNPQGIKVGLATISREELLKRYGSSSEQTELSRKSDKETIWQEKLKKVAELKDKIGGEMDEGIIETVAAFWLHDLPTSGSCEGHIDWGSGGPWIDVEAMGRPEERYNDEAEIKKKIADKFGVTPEAIDNYDNREEADEYWDEVTVKGETEEYSKFREQNQNLEQKVTQLLREFYSGHEVPDDIKLKIHGIGPSGMFRVYNGDFDSEPVNPINLTEEEKIALAEKLKNRQEEMRVFTQFLRNKSPK